MNRYLHAALGWRRRLASGFIGAIMMCPSMETVQSSVICLDPPAGPSGTLVVLRAPKEVASVTVGDKKVAIRGVEKTYLLTIPYDIQGECELKVNFMDGDERSASFTVQPGGTPFAPILESEPEVGYYSDGRTNASLFEIVAYGVGFDTESDIWINGKKITTYAAGFGMKSEHDVVLAKLSPGCEDACTVAQVPGRPVSCYERALVGLVSASDLEAGKEYTMTVKKRSGDSILSSGEVKFLMPSKTLTLKLDTLAGEFRSSSYFTATPDSSICFGGKIVTLRRTFTGAHLLLDLVPGNQLPYSGVDGLGKNESLSVPSVTEETIFDWFRQEDHPVDWMVRGLMLTGLANDGRSGDLLYGVRVNEPGAHGIAVFYSLLKNDPALLLRATMHELGHALGLTHCQGDDDGISLMNDCTSTSWKFEFSQSALACLNQQLESESLPVSRFRTFDGNPQNDCCKGKYMPPVVTCGDPPVLAGLPQPPPTLQPAPGFELQLSGPSIIQRGIPLILTASLLSASGSSADGLRRLDPSYGAVTYTITSPAGVTKTFVPYFSYDLSGADQKIAGGTAVKDWVPISCGADGYSFPDAALAPYTIQAVYRGFRGELAGMAVVSKPFALTVTDAPGPRGAGDTMASRDVCRFMSLGGARSLPEVEEKLAAVAATDGGELARYANLSLGLATLHRLVPIPNDANPADEALPFLKAADAAGVGNQDYFRIKLSDALLEGELARRSPDPRAARGYLQRLQQQYGGNILALPIIQLRQRQLQDYVSDRTVPFDLSELARRLGARCDRGGLTVSPRSTSISGLRERVQAVAGVGVLGEPIEQLPIRIEGAKAVIVVPVRSIDGVRIADSQVEVTASMARSELHLRISTLDLGLPAQFLAEYEPRPADLDVAIPVNVPCFAELPLKRDVQFELSGDAWGQIATGANRAIVNVVASYVDNANEPHRQVFKVTFVRKAP